MITQFKEFPDRINTAGKDFETVFEGIDSSVSFCWAARPKRILIVLCVFGECGEEQPLGIRATEAVRH